MGTKMDPETLSDASLQEEEDNLEEGGGEDLTKEGPFESSCDQSSLSSEEPRGFHGWRPEEIPVRTSPPTQIDAEDLSRPFKPYIFRRIPAYKYLESSEEIAGFSTTTLLKSGSNSSSSSSLAASGGSKAASKKKKVNVSISPSLSSKREWRPSSQYFKPLQMGWVREVILPVLPEGSEVVVLYHAPPPMTNKKNKTFKQIGELEAFLNHSNSGLSTLNFSFRKESMGAPSGQEIVRYENEDVEIFPNHSAKPPESSKKVALKHPSDSTAMKLKIKNVKPSEETKSSKKPEVNTRVINLDGDTNNLSSLLSPMLKDTLTKKDSTVNSRSSSSGKKQGGASVSNNNSGVGVSGGGSAGSNNSPFMNWPSSVSVSPASSKPMLRPKRTDHGACSIHCGGGASGFPSLSCSKCNSLFHPPCVGLGEGHSYSGYDFVCNNCCPVVEKENSAPSKKVPAISFSPVSSSSTSSSTSSSNPLRNTRSSSGTGGSGNSGSNSSSLSVTVNRVHGPGYSQNSVVSSNPPKKFPLRPIETQSVINIAGNKYLVVPAPIPKVVSTNNNGGGSSLNSNNNNTPSSTNAKRLSSSSSSKSIIPMLLKPVAGSDKLPSFEVEESPDGKLLLVPMSSTGLDKIVKRKKESEDKEAPDTKKFCRDITSNLTCAYYALIHVFKYLSTQERIQVSRVCRLWRDLVYHPSLWKTVSLRNTKVYNWQNFTEYLNRTRAPTLDFRKMSYVKGPDETWSDIFQVAPQFRYVSKLELPKISGNFLITLASKTQKLESISASNVLKEIDLEELVDRSQGLKEIKLKSMSGSLKISSLSRFTPLLSLHLTSLSLLSIEELTEADVIELSSLRDLKELSLGECTGISNIFEHISGLTNLKNLRLESVNVDASLRCMEKSSLEKLELVDSHLVQGFGSGFIKLRGLKKLLLIPVYKDEVAAINAEIVDFALSMPSLSHFCLGLTNEWLDSMNSILSMTSDKSGPVRDSFPILVNGVCEMYSLYKLFKTLSAALPMSKVKVLRMSQQATKMQHIGTLMS